MPAQVIYSLLHEEEVLGKKTTKFLLGYMGELLKYPRMLYCSLGSHSIKTGSCSIIRRISIEDKLLTLFCATIRISSPDLILADAAAERV